MADLSLKPNQQVFEELVEINLPARLLENWLKWSKDDDNLSFSIGKFIEHWSRKMEQALKEADWKQNFQYLLSQPLDPDLASEESFSTTRVLYWSLKNTNLGIQAFSRQDYSQAQHYVVGLNTSATPPNSIWGGGVWSVWGDTNDIDPDAGFEKAVTVSGDDIIYEVGVVPFDSPSK